MFHSHAKYLLILLLITGGVRLSAQTTTSSGTNTSDPLTGRENDPYSKFGIGDLQNGNSTVLKGMGNITSAFENPFEVNSDNPASYSFLKRVTYEAGFTASSRSIDAAGESYTTGTATISYLTLGIPINKNAGICLGFRPYSHTYYNLADTLQNSAIGQAERLYTGTGSMNYAYIGGAYRFKGLSIGVNVGYMFGNFNDITAIVPVDTQAYNRAYTTEYTNYNRIGGIYWKAGLMYETKIDSDYTICIGGTLTLMQSLSQRYTPLQISSYNFGDTLVEDTTNNPGQQQGKLKMPMSYSIGAILSKNNKWDVGLDYSATRWSQFNSTLISDTSISNSVAKQQFKISLGGEYTPDINNTRNYFSRVTYRFGLYYGNDYLNISGTQLPMYGLTAGASLPFRRSDSRVHLALEVGRMGSTSNGLIEETYVRFSLGLSFCNSWFIPRKYE